MTEFVIELLRLRGDEQWDDWGDQWWEYADILGELPKEGPGGWQLIDHFRGQAVKGKDDRTPFIGPPLLRVRG